MTSGLIARVLMASGLVATLLFILAPILIVVLGSFTREQYLSLPTTGFSLRYYKAIGGHPEVVDSFIVSAELGIVAALVSTVLGTMAALSLNPRLAGREPPFANAVTLVLLSPLMVPSIIIAMGILQFFSLMKVASGTVTLVAGHVVITLPYVVRMVTASLVLMERNIEWAAANLGAAPLRTLWHVVIPNIRGGIAAGGLFAFMVSFDAVTLSIFLASPTTKPLPVRLYDFVENAIDPIVASLSTLLILLSVVLIALLERIYGVHRIFGTPR